MAEPIADIDRARAAVDEGSWSEAYDRYLALEPLDDPHDRERFADAAWWTGRIEESMAARQRAYTGYAEAGDDRRAAWMSARLCIEHFFRDEPSVGAGWFARTQRHAKVLPDCVELGFAIAPGGHRAALQRRPGLGAAPDRARDRDRPALRGPRPPRDGDPYPGADPDRSGPRRRGRRAARRGDDLGGRRRAERLLHRRDLLQRDRGVPPDRRRAPGRRLGRGRALVGRVDPARVPVSGHLPDQPRRAREPAGRLAAGRRRGGRGPRRSC